jgi:non-specific serine/threonine protein kinase
MGDGWGASFPLRNLARGAWLQRDYRRSADLFGEGLALSRELGDKEGAAACLEGIAALAALQGQSGRAARLLGAAEALLEAAGATLSPPYRRIYERDLDAARSLVEEEAWAVAGTHGRELTLYEAAEYALRDPAQPQAATGPLSPAVFRCRSI